VDWQCPPCKRLAQLLGFDEDEGKANKNKGKRAMEDADSEDDGEDESESESDEDESYEDSEGESEDGEEEDPEPVSQRKSNKTYHGSRVNNSHVIQRGSDKGKSGGTRARKLNPEMTDMRINVYSARNSRDLIIVIKNVEFGGKAGKEAQTNSVVLLASGALGSADVARKVLIDDEESIFWALQNQFYAEMTTSDTPFPLRFPN
jgi:hypothetical protein